MMKIQQNKSTQCDTSEGFFELRQGGIAVNTKCNQNCYFCDKISPAGYADETPETMYRKLKLLRETSASVTFTGGEPTIDRNLATYIKEAAGLGFKSIQLETNGLMLSYPEYAARILSSGLTHIVFMQVSRDPEFSDAATQFPGGWELNCKGIYAAAGTQVKTAVSIPLLKQTIADIEQHIRFISRKFPHVSNIFLQLITPENRRDFTAGGAEIAEGAETKKEFARVSVAELEAVLPRALDAACEAGIGLRVRPGAFPAPCLFRQPEGLRPLFVSPPIGEKAQENFHRIGQCEDCFLKGCCPGIHPQFDPREAIAATAPTAKFAALALKQWPARDEQTSKRAGVENEFGLSAPIKKDGAEFVEEVLIRINYNCNQRCLFCWVEPGYENISEPKVKSYIEKLRQYDIGAVCITGGEPTLNPNLIEYIKMLKTDNIRKVCLQTNAVLLHREEKASALARAGLDFALVSLHSHRPDISDMLTGLAGSFDKTIEGISNLRKNGVLVLISHVINSFNYKNLPEFVKFAASSLERTPIVFSTAAPIYGAMMDRSIIPRLGEIKKHLTTALDLCYELRVPFSGLPAMCGVPLCIFDGNHRYYPDAKLLGPREDSPDMIKTAACSGCGLSTCCLGLRKYYAGFYGTDELRPVSAEGFKPREPDILSADFIVGYFSEVPGD